MRDVLIMTTWSSRVHTSLGGRRWLSIAQPGEWRVDYADA